MAKISPEEFVKTWQACKTAEEARKKLGQSASVRASLYRRRGIPLKRFGRGIQPLDVAALKKLAQKAA